MTAGPRYGVLSDVHGNLVALHVALAALAELGVDRCLHLGDLVGYGPHPNECVDVIAERVPVGVAGNHEQIALGRLDFWHCTPTAETSLRWTRQQLGPSQRAFLARLPLLAHVPGAVLAHGSPEAVTEYVRSGERALELLRRLDDHSPQAPVLLLGHTHQAWAHSERRGTLLRGRPGRVAWDEGDRVLLNPGSVGQSRDRRAHVRFLVVDLGARVAEFHSLGYDLGACRQALRERGLPASWCHTPPPLAHVIRGALGAALRRAGRR